MPLGEFIISTICSHSFATHGRNYTIPPTPRTIATVDQFDNLDATFSQVFVFFNFTYKMVNLLLGHIGMLLSHGIT